MVPFAAKATHNPENLSDGELERYMDITILVYLEPGDERPDVVAEQVATALGSRGHKPSILTIRHDVSELVEGLRKRKPSLTGVVALSVDVNAGGGVDKVTVTSNDTGSSELSGCIVKRAYGLQFPPPRYGAGLTLTYPLRFVPDK